MSRFKKLKEKVGVTSDGSVPVDQALYKRVVAEAKRKFDRFPSGYASSYIVKTYKQRGGKYR